VEEIEDFLSDIDGKSVSRDSGAGSRDRTPCNYNRLRNIIKSGGEFSIYAVVQSGLSSGLGYLEKLTC
jgi:hypothetical protein